MNGLDLARALNVEPRGLHYFDPTDGRSAVVGGYTVGRNSLLVQAPVLARPPGSSVWLVRCDPRTPGDGPSYMIDVATARRFVTGPPSPPVPPLEARMGEHRQREADWTRTQLDLNAGEDRYWIQSTVGDAVDTLADAPRVFAAGAGWVAGQSIKAVTGALGGAAGAFYGALPWWVQVGIPVGVAALGVAGVVTLARTLRPPVAS